MSEDFTGTGAVQERYRFDVARLEPFLAERIAGFRGPLAVSQFKGGQSNPTFLLETPGARYVMRRKPAPAAKLLPSAHAVEREYRAITALGQTGMPVPRTYCLCEDEGRHRPRVLRDGVRRRPSVLGAVAARTCRRPDAPRSTTR